MCTMVVVFGGWHLWTCPYIDTPQEISLHSRYVNRVLLCIPQTSNGLLTVY